MTTQIAAGAEEKNQVTDEIMHNIISIQDLAELLATDANGSQHKPQYLRLCQQS